MKRDELTGLLRPLASRMWRGHCWKKTPDGPRRIAERFTEIHLSEHVMGGAAYGLCPIAPGESTCRVACFDLDSHKGEVPWSDMVLTAGHLAMSLEMEGLLPHLFKSSGGSGIHIYLTWAEPQDAYSVRELLRAALASVNLKSGTKGIANSEVEIFPKQDEVPSDGYGSMFILPWSGRSESIGSFEGWHDSAPVPVRDRPERSVNPASTAALPGLARIQSALDAIPNTGESELSYDNWRNIIFALHHATGGSDTGLSLAHEFSARSSKYDGDFLDNRVWPYARADRAGPSITEGTLYAAAAGNGWQDTATADDFDTVVHAAVGSATVAGEHQRFIFVPEAQFAAVTPPSMIVQDVIPDADLVVVFGESGSGKSFWTLDIVQCVARGVPWRDKHVTQGRVAYIAAEGAGGFRKRITAYKREHRLDTTDLFVLADSPSFLEAAHVKDVIKRLRDVGPVKLVVIDTLAQVGAGGDENSSADMGKIVLHCRMIRKHTGATVILIHHSGKDASKGARGHSSLKGATDAEIEIVRAEDDRVATVTKQKDGEDGMEFGFKLRQVPIGLNAAGNEVSSCVVDHGAAITKSSRMAHKKTGDVGEMVAEVVVQMFEVSGEWPTQHELCDFAKTKLLGSEDGKQQYTRVRRALERLLLAGRLEERGGRIVSADHEMNMQKVTNT